MGSPLSRFAGIAVVAGATVAIGVAALLPSSSSSPTVRLVTPAAQVADAPTSTSTTIEVAFTPVTAAPASHVATAPAQTPAAPATVDTTPTTVAPTQVTTATSLEPTTTTTIWNACVRPGGPCTDGHGNPVGQTPGVPFTCGSGPDDCRDYRG